MEKLSTAVYSETTNSSFGVYLAAPFQRKAEIAEVARELRGMKYSVVSTWHDRAEPANYTFLDARQWAVEELFEIEQAYLLVVFTGGTGPMTGGKDVELGYAMGKGIRTCRVGPRVNIFHSLDHYMMFTSPQEFVQAMNPKSWGVK